MSKAIVETCNTCRGHHVIDITENCWDCRGTGREAKRVEQDCKACNATGTYVRKIGKHKHICRPCIKCKGKGKRLVWVKSSKPCATCEGTGDYRKRKKCPTCKGKGRKTINALGDLFPADFEKALQLTETS